MEPRDFVQRNKILLAAPDLRGCRDLPVMTDGEACVSCWQPTPEDLARLFAGAPIYLVVYSGATTQPPVTLCTVPPFAPTVLLGTAELVPKGTG